MHCVGGGALQVVKERAQVRVSSRRKLSTHDKTDEMEHLPLMHKQSNADWQASDGWPVAALSAWPPLPCP